MRINKFLFPPVIIIAFLVSSCMDDASTGPANEIKGVVIDTTGMGSFEILQFDTLRITPNVLTELSDARLSYQWKVNISPGDTLYEVIGDEKQLVYEVKLRPSDEDDPYQLIFTATDSQTGLEYIMYWPLRVLNSLGEGLVVAASTDGSTTDLSLIMAPRVTEGYGQVSVKNHLYSSINQKVINGLVKDMQFTQIYGVNALLAITDNSIVRVNTLEYTFAGKNQELFFAHSATFNPQMLDKIYQRTVYVEDGELTATYLGASKKLGVSYDFPFAVPDVMALNGNASGFYEVQISFYDEENEYFVYMPTTSSFGDDAMYQTPAASGKAFNPASVPNKVNVAAGISLDGNFRHLLKDKTSGEYVLYILDGGSRDYPDPLVPPGPKALYDLAEAPEIQKAHEFVLPNNQKVMYYATDQKIYAVLYGGQTPVYELRYTAPAGETITTLQLYHQVGYPRDSDDIYIDTNGRQLIMSTYNGSEGRVYLLPITNLGIGLIDEANIVSFGGFGQVMAITPQK